MSDQQLVLAIFADEAAADGAVVSLENWDAALESHRLAAIGVLVVDEAGKIKEHKLGARSSGKGAAIGMLLAVVAPPTLLAGMVGGAVRGHFHHKGLGLTSEDRERIGGELQGGKAAVGVLVISDDVAAVSAWLTELGGAVEVHEASVEAVEAAASATPASPSEASEAG